jgi:Helix-turn-helix domain
MFSSTQQARAFWTSEQRFLRRIQANKTHSARNRLTEAPPCLSLRRVAIVLGCSKSTVRKLLELGLLKALPSRVGKQRQIRVASDRVHLFLQFCDRVGDFVRYFPEATPGRRKLLDIPRRFTRREYLSLPAALTAQEAVAILGCSSSSVVRLIRRGEIDGFRISPCRWRVSKRSFRHLIDVPKSARKSLDILSLDFWQFCCKTVAKRLHRRCTDSAELL